MLYAATKGLVLSIFRAPSEAPEPPSGAHAAVEVFRASPRFLTYRLLGLAAFATLPAAPLGGAIVSLPTPIISPC